MATVIAEGARPRARGGRSRIYVSLAIMITLIVGAGFGRSFYGTFVGGVAHPWVIHVHAAVYVGWIALLIAQTVLAARGEIDAHRKVGRFGIAWGLLVFLMGLVVSVAMPVINVHAGALDEASAEQFLAIPLGDMVLFGGFFGAAIAYRGRPAIHKRLIVLAAVAIMFAAITRSIENANALLGREVLTGNAPRLLLWFSPVIVAVAHELVTRRRIHPVYLIGIVAMGAGLLRIPYSQTEQWHAIARRILEPFM